MAGNVAELTDANFDETISSSEVPVLVDFWAPWCGPCRMIAPVIDEMAKDHAGKVVYAKLNTDESRAVAHEYGIMSIPTLLVFKDGELVERLVGSAPRSVLEPKITAYL